MVILNNGDIFTVTLASLIGDYDRDTITNLYQPLVGYKAVALYFTFWSEANIQKVNPSGTHENLLAKMQISVAEFIKAKKALEGVGLVGTFLEQEGDTKIYHYVLYAPKTPSEFFNDTLLYGLLINYIGEVDAKKLNQYYAAPLIPGGQNISATFEEIFHPNFEDKAFLKALKSDPTSGRNRAKMKLEFTFERFFTSLKEVSQISEKAFSKQELNEIARLASLNAIDEARAANIVSGFYNPELPKGERVDLDAITKAFQEETNYSYLSSFKGKGFNSKKPNLVSSKGALAQKINMMETIAPKDYLTILQNGTEPALSDLKLINHLSKKFKLNNAVINAVVDYTLIKNNNVLVWGYAEKICASLVRSNIETALDAMNYLKSISSKKRKVVEQDSIETEDKPAPQKEEKVTEEEWDNLLKEIGDDPIGGDDDGKA